MILIMVTVVTLSACKKEDTSVNKEIYALDTIITITANNCSEETLSLCQGEIHWMESVFSKTSEGSDIDRINTNAGNFVEVEDSVFEVLKTACEVSENTNGAFDVTVAPAMDLWGFSTDNYRVPSEEVLHNILPYIDYKNIKFDETNKSICIDSAQSIDAGGIAKGYVADYAAEYLMSEGVTSAILNFGGNIRLIGSKSDSSLWNIGIKAPFEDGYFATVKLSDKTLSTAGGYERYFEENGKIYHHIIDPSTASPAKSDIISSTVIGHGGALCDALSTAVFVSGTKSLEDTADKYPSLDFIALTENSVYITENISKTFSLSEGFEDIEIIII